MSYIEENFSNLNTNTNDEMGRIYGLIKELTKSIEYTSKIEIEVNN